MSTFPGVVYLQVGPWILVQRISTVQVDWDVVIGQDDLPLDSACLALPGPTFMGLGRAPHCGPRVSGSAPLSLLHAGDVPFDILAFLDFITYA